MRAIVAESWDHLLSELYRDDLVKELDRHRSPFAFRGLSRDYNLLPSLSRLGHPSDLVPRIERYLINSFRKYAHQDVERGISSWRWLAIAQHHGLPTRLMDWTYSPFVALHFATSDLTAYDSDGVVWCLNVFETRTFLPGKLLDALNAEGTAVFSIETLESIYPDFWDIDQDDLNRQFIVFFEPPSLNARIVNQIALFSFISPPDAKLGAWLAERPSEEALAKKVVIPRELKWQVRDKLDQANMTERVLFPGLDGLSTWLRRWYSPKEPVGQQFARTRADDLS
jgi:hypothetical protein